MLMEHSTLKIVILGRKITSLSDDIADRHRALMRELVARGHEILYLERMQPGDAGRRDSEQSYERVDRYESILDLQQRFTQDIHNADCVIVGSYILDGVAIGEWLTSVVPGVTAVYDAETPRTLEKLEAGECEHLTPELIRRYDLYLSLSDGRVLKLIEQRYRSPRARHISGSSISSEHLALELETYIYEAAMSCAPRS